MPRSVLVALVVMMGAAVAAPAASGSAPLTYFNGPGGSFERKLPDLSGCLSHKADVCIPGGAHREHFFNPNFGSCEYQITVEWGDRTSESFTLRDQAVLPHFYAKPGLYRYRSSSPPGTPLGPGAQCPGGEYRRVHEVPLDAAQARLVKKVIRLARRQLRLSRKADRAGKAQKKLVKKQFKLAKSGKKKLKQWKKQGLPKKRKDPGAKEPLPLHAMYKTLKDYAGRAKKVLEILFHPPDRFSCISILTTPNQRLGPSARHLPTPEC